MANKKPTSKAPSAGTERSGLAVPTDVEVAAQLPRCIGQPFPDLSRSSYGLLQNPKYRAVLTRHAADIDKRTNLGVAETLARIDSYAERYERRERLGWSFARVHQDVVRDNVAFKELLDAAAAMFNSAGKNDPIRRDPMFALLLKERATIIGQPKARRTRNAKRRAMPKSD